MATAKGGKKKMTGKVSKKATSKKTSSRTTKKKVAARATKKTSSSVARQGKTTRRKTAAKSLSASSAQVARADATPRITAPLRPDGLADMRRRPRHRCQTIPCSLGEVLDLSMDGARVLCRKRLRGSCVLVMPRGHGWFAMPSRVIWTRRLGFRRHLLGLEFIEVNAPDILASIIKKHRMDDREAA